MSLLLAIFLAQVQDPIELGDKVRNESYDFEIGIPKNWESRPSNNTFFRVQAPAGSLADGAVWLVNHDSNHPVTLAFLTETFLTRASTEYKGFKSLTERDVTAGGFPGRQIVFSATAKGDKELVFAHTLIQRQLQEYFILDVVGAAREKERVLELSDKMLASFRTGLPGPKDRDARIAKTAALLKAAPARPGLAGTQWHELTVAKQKLGWQKHVLREAKVDGAPGWEFEIEFHQEDDEGGKRSDISKGAFTVDGAIQRVEFQRHVKTPKDPPVDVRESASIVRGAFKATREFLGQKVEKKFEAPEGTYLGDIAETIRRYLALAPAGTNAIRVLEPFRDVAVVEEWENGGPGRIRVDDKELELIQALVTFGRQIAAEHLYDLDGSLRRRKGNRGLMILRRCTEEEAVKR